ncbi:MAG: M48 family metallopeptidase [Dehalococcoidia bacterium]
MLKKIVGMFGERSLRLAFQADSVRVSPRQFPHLHRLWLNVHDTLDAQDQYDLYVSQSPFTNAGAFGIDKPWVMLNSGSLRLLTDDEVEFVMGHEMGHVLSGHALYHTMLVILYQLARMGFPLIGLVALPVLIALFEWYRKSELSCDRAGLLAVQLPDAAMGSMMRIAGGGTREEMNLYEFLLQAEEYRGATGFLDQIFKVLNTMWSTHPFLVLRAALIRDWIEEGSYDRIVHGEYPRRGDAQPDWRDDVSAGVRHYTAGAEAALDRAGESITDTLKRMREAFDRGFKGNDKDTTSDSDTDSSEPGTGG